MDDLEQTERELERYTFWLTAGVVAIAALAMYFSPRPF
jgi:hypothetical protein